MKITLCGSVNFASNLVDIYKKLEELGHQPLMHEHMFDLAKNNSRLLQEYEAERSLAKRKYNYIKMWYNLIIISEAILVCNYDKNGIKNYIGGNVLMEMGFAHVNDKKIFLLNPIPEEVSYVDEIKSMVSVILEGDLTKI